MKMLLALLMFSVSTAYAAEKQPVPKLTYEQHKAAMEKAHQEIVEKECAPNKRYAVHTCREEANEQLARNLKDLRERFKKPN